MFAISLHSLKEIIKGGGGRKRTLLACFLTVTILSIRELARLTLLLVTNMLALGELLEKNSAQ